MPHPAFLGVHVSAFHQDRETRRNQLFDHIHVASVAHNARQAGLRVDVFQHFVRHHVAVFFQRLDNRFYRVLVALPAPIREQHGQVGWPAVIEALTLIFDSGQSFRARDGRGGWRRRLRRRGGEGGLFRRVRRGGAAWHERGGGRGRHGGQRGCHFRLERAFPTRVEGFFSRGLKKVLDSGVCLRDVIVCVVLYRGNLVQSDEQQRQGCRRCQRNPKPARAGLGVELALDFFLVFISHNKLALYRNKNNPVLDGKRLEEQRNAHALTHKGGAAFPPLPRLPSERNLFYAPDERSPLIFGAVPEKEAALRQPLVCKSGDFTLRGIRRPQHPHRLAPGRYSAGFPRLSDRTEAVRTQQRQWSASGSEQPGWPRESLSCSH